MSIKSLMIPCVESQYTHEYIANVLWYQHIAKVSSVTLIPIINSKEYNVAYILLDKWCDSEVAYNFIKRLNNPNLETRIVYDEDNWWPVYRCSELSHHFTDKTITFNTAYFEKDIDKEEEPAACYDWLLFMENRRPPFPLIRISFEEEKECSDWQMFKEHIKHSRPIKGLFGDFYTQEEAAKHLFMLKKHAKKNPQLNRDDDLLKKEIEHLENELRIHQAVEYSQNVTPRRVRFSAKVC